MSNDDVDVAAFGGGLSGPTQWREDEEARRAAGGGVPEGDGPKSSLTDRGKDELLALAEANQVDVSASSSKAKIAAALEAAGVTG